MWRLQKLKCSAIGWQPARGDCASRIVGRIQLEGDALEREQLEWKYQLQHWKGIESFHLVRAGQVLSCRDWTDQVGQISSELQQVQGHPHFPAGKICLT